MKKLFTVTMLTFALATFAFAADNTSLNVKTGSALPADIIGALDQLENAAPGSPLTPDRVAVVKVDGTFCSVKHLSNKDCKSLSKQDMFLLGGDSLIYINRSGPNVNALMTLGNGVGSPITRLRRQRIVLAAELAGIDSMHFGFSKAEAMRIRLSLLQEMTAKFASDTMSTDRDPVDIQFLNNVADAWKAELDKAQANRTVARNN